MSNMIFSTKLQFIKPSPTLSIAALAMELRRQGMDVISLSAGEPDYDTPDNIKQAAINAINAGHTKYTNVEGILELRTAIAHRITRDYGCRYSANNIIVSTGGKQVIFNLFMASLNTFDEVIIPAPCWVSYTDIVSIAGGVPKIVETDFEDDFKITPKQLEKAISPKTKWLILNYPSNPTGVIYSKEELRALADVLLKYPHVYIMSDDIYEFLVYDDHKFYNLLQVAPELYERMFIVNGVSKSYAMTGWRIGYGVGDAKLVKAMTAIQSQSTTNASSISQYAALEAITGPQDFLHPNAMIMQKKRDAALEILNKCNLIKCFKPAGALYIFAKCEDTIGKEYIDGHGNKKIIEDCVDFCNFLLEMAMVAVVPGEAFAKDNHFRISFSTSMDNLLKGCNRIVDACNMLK